MERRKPLLFLLLCACLNGFSQSLVIGSVQDAFLKTPLPQAKVSLLLAADSSVVMDSIPLQLYKREDGTISATKFNLSPEKKTCKYLFRATLKGYEDAWMPLSIDGGNEGVWLMDEPLELQRMREEEMKEVVVTATRIKMYYKGDTLIYDAQAFKLPDGSMLDDLIRQMPGVTLNDDGEIFVNGKKVDELLLGSRSFMKGNKKVLMENLPYYTVKNIKVYDKMSDESEALGFDVGGRKYVMDVNLKPEYSVGYIANVEAAGGTEDRWLARGFLLGFTNQWRYAVMANANNVNETRHISGDGQWTPATMPKSLVTTRSVAANLNYQSPNKNIKNDLTADYASTETESETRQRYEQFLDGSTPTSRTHSTNNADNWRVKLNNSLTLSKPFYLFSSTDLEYGKNDGMGATSFYQWDDTLLTASKQTDALSKGRTWSVQEFVQGALGKENKYYTSYTIQAWHRGEQSWQSSRYDTWQNATQANELQYNAYDVSRKYSGAYLRSYWSFPDVLGKAKFYIEESLDFNRSNHHDYLYHPDTLLLASQLDMLTAITDPGNSYDMDLRQWKNNVSLGFLQWGNSGVFAYEKWSAGVDIRFHRNTMDYQRGNLDTLMRVTKVYLLPYAKYKYISPKNKHDFSVSATYDHQPVQLYNQVSYHDDSQPLVVKDGNPNLKGTKQTRANADYNFRFGKRSGMLHAGASLNYDHRSTSQSVSYNSGTGVYTYKPMNISGAYRLTFKLDLSAFIDEKQRWTWQMNADANYNHALDHSIIDGATESTVNAVNTLTLHDKAYIQYNKNSLNVRLTGEISWRHSEGEMRDYETLDAFDYRYGVQGRYTIPRIKTTVSVDANMYSRRGYGSSELNSDDFVFNASLSQPFLKGKLIARVEAFDLFHQLSATQYTVTAQGRTESWYRSLPRYVMLHLVYHWNKNPKK